MPFWQWLLDVAGVVLGVVLLYGIALIVRRRVLARRGGTFELSHRARTDKSGRGWVLGLGRYTPTSLEWFRIFSLNPRPKYVWQRADLTYVDRRVAGGVEQLSLYPDHVVIRCTYESADLELALSQEALMGFQAWLEAAPPGAAPHL
jgi:Protein of unknown function (DUF2550)